MPQTLESGTRIGGLIIGEMLGRGAMGEVFSAEQVALKRPVAVKRIAGHLVGQEGVLARFEREAQCIAKIQHQNVLAVYDFGSHKDHADDEHWLLVMELVAGGRSARNYVNKARVDWKLVTSIVAQVAEGLAVANEYGIVHRDIKPDNIMVTSRGVAKLADFGLAKAADSQGMTMDGSLLGTPHYMPPEACQGDPVDHSGDIYSLGATWFHLLTGRPPFQASSTMMLLRAHVEQAPPDISSIAPEVPKKLIKLVAQCLEKDPKKRPKDAHSLASAIWDLAADGIVIPRTLSDGLPQSSGNVSTVATVVPGTEQTVQAETLRNDLQETTVGGLLQKEDAPKKGNGILLVVVALLVIAAAAGGGVWFAQQGAKPDDNGPDPELPTEVVTTVTADGSDQGNNDPQPDSTDPDPIDAKDPKPPGIDTEPDPGALVSDPDPADPEPKDPQPDIIENPTEMALPSGSGGFAGYHSVIVIALDMAQDLLDSGDVTEARLCLDVVDVDGSLPAELGSRRSRLAQEIEVVAAAQKDFKEFLLSHKVKLAEAEQIRDIAGMVAQLDRLKQAAPLATEARLAESHARVVRELEDLIRTKSASLHTGGN